MPAAAEVSSVTSERRASTQARLLLDARRGDKQARAELVFALTPLIGSVARTYRNAPGIDRLELMQEGVVGALRALERFDPDLGTPFWAYASWWVRQAMQQLVAERSRPVVLSDRAMRQLARVREARRNFVRAHSRDPDLGELANDAELTPAQLQRLIVAERQPRGLEEQVDRRTHAGATYGELLRDPTAEEAYEELAVRLGAAEVPRLLACLSERERAVIEGRYGFDGRERTLRELGQTMGVSAERVRQIEETALERLRAGRGGPRRASAQTNPPRRCHSGDRRAGRRHAPRARFIRSERELRLAADRR
jgi:RNA polymerase sigma factor (sigma-70 family)